MDKNTIAAKAFAFLFFLAGTACAAGFLSSQAAHPAPLLPAVSPAKPQPVTETHAPAEAEIQAALRQTDGC